MNATDQLIQEYLQNEQKYVAAQKEIIEKVGDRREQIETELQTIRKFVKVIRKC